MMDSPIQLIRLKWFCGQILALLSLWTISALDLARGPVWAGVLLLTLVVTVWPHLPGRVPLAVRRWLAPVLILVFLGDLILSGRDIIPPMVRLLLILLAIRILTVRRNREDLQLILLAMFLSVVSGVFTLSMLFAFQACLFAMVSIGLLFLVNLLESTGQDGEGGADWERFSWSAFLGDLRRSLSMRMLRSLVVLLVLLMVTTGVLFVSIPRVYLDQAIPFLKLPQAGMSGFSDIVRLGDVTSIQQDDTVAIRVDVPGIESVPSDPYWRMLILDEYAKGAFVNSLFLAQQGSRSFPQVHSLSPFPPGWFMGDNPSSGNWTFYMENGVSQYLPMLGPFAELTFQGRQSIQSNPDVLVFRIPEASSSVFSYQVKDFLVNGEIPASSLDRPLVVDSVPGDDSERERYPYTTLEVPLEPEEKEILDGILAGILEGTEKSPEEVAGKILEYLRKNHTYTLSPGGFGPGDPVVQWLEEKRAGHCEFFAGAFTLLARSAGIPTRMVVGFSGGSWNSYEDYFVVRNRNAHAWCEILDGKSWIRFDPTPGGGRGRGAMAGTLEGGGFQRESDFRAWVDSLRVMWYRQVINFDDSSQQNIIEDFSGFFRSAGEVVQEFFRALWGSLRQWAVATYQTLRESGLAALAGLMVVGLVIFLFRRTGLIWMDVGRIGVSDPLRRRAGRELRRLEGADAVQEEQLRTLKRIREGLLEVRFGPHPETASAIRLFREARRIRREIR